MNSSQRHTNKSSTELWLHKSCSTGRMFFATELLKSESLRVENLTEEKAFFFLKKTYGNLEWKMMILYACNINTGK